MAIDTPQHYIPDITPATRIIVNVTQQYKVEVNTTTTNTTLVVPMQQRAGVPVSVELVIIALVVVALAFLLISLGLQRVEEYRRAEARVRGRIGYRYEQLYRYEGARLQLRRVYEELLSRASSMGVLIPRGYTVTEASERLKRVVGGWASWFARIYNRYMYGLEEPPPDVIDEARRKVES